MTRKLMAALILGLALLLSTSGRTTLSAPGDRIPGGELTVATYVPHSLDPHVSSFAQDISLHRMLWRGLYTITDTGAVQPAMAASLPSVSPDGRNYMITLRSGLVWSDGNDLTAEDFEMGIKRSCNPVIRGEFEYILTNIVGCDDHYYNPGGFSQGLEDAIGVNATGPTTLQIQLYSAQRGFTSILSMSVAFPVPIHRLPNTSAPWPVTPSALAYNGPYVLSQYSPATQAVVLPNEHWAAPNGISPTLDRLTVKFVDNLAVADAMFDSEQVDFANVSTAQLNTIVGQHPDEYARSVKPYTRALFVQMSRPPLGNPQVRLALSRAINRGQLNTTVGGAFWPTTTWLPQSTFGPVPNAFETTIGFSPSSAQQHMADAGFPGGAGFPTLEIVVPDNPTTIQIGAFLHDSFLNVLGVNTTVTPLGAALAQRFLTEDFDLFVGGWIEDYPDPENWIVGLFDTTGWYNKSNCSDPDVDFLVSQAVNNPNNAQRISQYQQANTIVSTELCGAVPLWHQANHYLIATDVAGMRERQSGHDASIAGDWIPEAWGIAADGDSDGDGVINISDECMGTAQGQAVDALGCSDAQVDPDADGYCSASAPSGGPSGCTAIDNCATIYNPNGQLDDADGDLAGDACDGPGTGNVDCSGPANGVTAIDALKVLRYVAGLPISQSEPCLDIGQPREPPSTGIMGDVDCSGSVTAVDALKILRAVAGLPVAKPAECPEIKPP